MVAYLAGHRADAYYSRDPLSTLLLAAAPSSIRRKAIYEAHTFPASPSRQRSHLWAIKRIGGVVSISEGLASEYRSRGVPESRILVAPDAVDLSRFSQMPGRQESREQLGIPEDLKVVCYTGHLYRWKGAHALAEASRRLPGDYLVKIVGGTADDVREFRSYLDERGLTRVKLEGWVPPEKVIPYLAAADVLVLPNSASDVRSSHYTSPMKLFEYMAARRPIVASRLPSLEEVLRHEENALLVDPDNPAALAEGIQRAASSEPLAKRLVEQAWDEVQGYSWEARARRILDFIGS